MGIGFMDFLVAILFAAFALSICAGAIYLTVCGLRALLRRSR